MTTQIRSFVSYDDALKAVAEAGFRYTGDSNQGSLKSYAPTVYYAHPDTGERVEVKWASDRGYIARLD